MKGGEKMWGILNDKLHGFYRSTYQDPSGRDRILACTQFESTDARRAFDEFAGNAARSIAMINAQVPTERRAEVVLG